MSLLAPSPHSLSARTIRQARLAIDPPFALCALCVGAGLLIISCANILSARGYGVSYWLFWVGIAAIVVPVATRLTARQLTRADCLGSTLALGMALYIAKVLRAPTGFEFHDEFAHWRNAENLLVSGHLFGFNPLLPATAFYPGLAAATSAVSELSGLSLFVSGLLVIGAARLILILALFLIIERLATWRLAGITCMVYVSNPNFLYWNAQYAYESLALPLALLVIFFVYRIGETRTADGVATQRYGGPFASVIPRFTPYRIAAIATLSAVIVTHHIVSYAVSFLLIAWTVVAWWHRRRGNLDAYVPLGMALFSTIGSLAWLFLVARRTISYLTPVFSRTLSGGLNLLVSGQQTRQLFTGGTLVAPTWERIVGVLAVVLLLSLAPTGLLFLLYHKKVSPLTVVLAAGPVLYVLLLPLRLVATGQETANRSSEYVFIGMGLVDGIVLTDFVLKRMRSFAGRAIAGGYLTLVFLGGVCVSWAFYDRLTPDFATAAIPLDASPSSVAAATWMRETLGPNHRVATDLTDSLSVGSYGLQHPVSGATDNARIWRLFFPTTLNADVRQEIHTDRVRFVLSNIALSKSTLPSGAYFDPGEPHVYTTRPLPYQALVKFDHLPGASLLYDAGRLRLYDLGAPKS